MTTFLSLRCSLLSRFSRNTYNCLSCSSAVPLAGFQQHVVNVSFSFSNKVLNPPLVCSTTRRFLTTNSPIASDALGMENLVSGSSRSLSQTVRDLYDRYAPMGLLFHSGVAIFSILFWWALVHNPDIDVTGFLGRMGFLSPLTLLISKTVESFGAGTFAVAYIVHKATGPIRLLLTIFCTPYLVRRYGLRQTHRFVQSTKLKSI